MSTARGLVIKLTAIDTLLRCRRMDNHHGVAWFDPALPVAPEGYYRLSYPNGGTDPTATDHFAHWKRGAKKANGEYDTVWVSPTDPTFHFVTGDCVSKVAWAKGFDRLQPVRGKHLQGGAINCDFMVADANGPAKCFVRHDKPYPGLIVTYKSLADQDHDGERDGAGHTGIVIGWDGALGATPVEWDPKEKDCWIRLMVSDCASRTPHLADQQATARAWFGSRTGEAGISVPKGSIFVESIMQP